MKLGNASDVRQKGLSKGTENEKVELIPPERRNTVSGRQTSAKAGS